MTLIIQSLQAKQWVWQANHLNINPQYSVSSGYPLLDQKLGGGWPDAGIIELQCQHFGIGEVRLLLPALRQLVSGENNRQSLLFWVSPPGYLNAQAIAVAGLPLSHTLVAKKVNESDAFWLTEQALRSGCCSGVILWCNELTPTQAKRLQLAAKQGHCLGFLLRPTSQVEQSLPVSIRARLDVADCGLTIAIHKRLGGYPVQPFKLDMSQLWPQLYPQNNKRDNITPIGCPAPQQES